MSIVFLKVYATNMESPTLLVVYSIMVQALHSPIRTSLQDGASIDQGSIIYGATCSKYSHETRVHVPCGAWMWMV